MIGAKPVMRSSKPPFRYQNLAFKTSKSARAQQAFQDLIKLYGNTQIEKADAIIVLGGDGFMLDTVRKQMKKISQFWDELWYGWIFNEFIFNRQVI